MQYHTACKIFDEKLSVRETEKLVKQFKEKPIRGFATIEDEFICRDIEERIRNIIGTKVSIHKEEE